jgi:hypothetical protein
MIIMKAEADIIASITASTFVSRHYDVIYYESI